MEKVLLRVRTIKRKRVTLNRVDLRAEKLRFLFTKEEKLGRRMNGG